MKEAFSQEDDVTLANPWGPFGRERQEVKDKLDRLEPGGWKSSIVTPIRS